MKSEERHRLQETELEKWGRHAHSFWETFLKDYAKIALAAVLVVCVIAGVLTWYFVSSANEKAERWNEVITASFDQDPSQSLVQLSDAASNFPDHPAGQWAALLQAEGALSEGIRLTRTNRPAAVEELLRARDSFANLANAESEILQERRAFGMARTLEALAGVDVSKDDKGQNVKGVEEALTKYDEFVTQYPTSIFVPLAESRIKALKDPQTQDFYAWYRDQYPRPEDRPEPKDGFSPPGGGSGLPAGHPPISPGGSPLSPGGAPPFPPGLGTTPSGGTGGEPATEESLIDDLEKLNQGDTSPLEPKDSDQPAKGEEPLPGGGPALVPPNTPDSETKSPEKSEPPTPDETPDVKPASEADEKKAEDKSPEKPATEADGKKAEDKPAEKPSDESNPK